MAIVRFDVDEGEQFAFFIYLPSLLGVSKSISGMLDELEKAIWMGLVLVLALLVLRFVLRKKWMAAVALVAYSTKALSLGCGLVVAR